MRNIQIGAAILALVSAVTAGRADPPPPPVATPYHDDGTGVIVDVLLSARRPDVPDRVFRFLLDTGAMFNVVDLSVPPAYYWNEPDDAGLAPATVKDASSADLPAKFVALKSMTIGGIAKSGQVALRMDLRSSSLGRSQDRPVDGLIGMNFLRETRFVIDPRTHQIQWGAVADGHRVKLYFNEGLVPVLPGLIDGTTAPFTLDTGDGGGFSGPGDPDGPGPFETVYGGGLSGVMVEGSRVSLDKVEANGRSWRHAPGVVYSVPGTPISVGRCILLAAPLGLDFIHNWVIFEPGADGDLQTSACSGPEMGVEWLWVGDRRELRIGALGPHSGMARAGFKAGDRIVRVGALNGDALSIRAIGDILRPAQPVEWEVQRDGKALRLNWPVVMPGDGHP